MIRYVFESYSLLNGDEVIKMANIKIEDLPADKKISKEDMK